MSLKLVAFAATCVLQAFASKIHQVSEWYPCALFTYDNGIVDKTVKCGKFSAPLCYSDICKPPEGVNQTIELLVKRYPASNPETAINIWILDGDVETKELSAVLLKRHLDANVYMMDARGSGKSTSLDCGMTIIDPEYNFMMNPAEVESCALILESMFGDLVAFSPMSAAHDLFDLISKLSNGAHTFVYGTNYGALTVKRLMLLAPPEVIGYVLDSPMGTTGVYNYYTEKDFIENEVARTFMERCDHDRVCSSHFKAPDTLFTAYQDIITTLDNQVDSACSEVMNTMDVKNPKWPASFKLRALVSSLLSTPALIMTIPQLVYHFKRCQPHDVKVLTKFIRNVVNRGHFFSGPNEISFEVLSPLIRFSELWERPTPSLEELRKRFTNSFSGWGIYTDVPLYCAFSKEQSKVCDKYNFGKYEARGVIYKRDRYWNASVTIPSQASVLVLSSKMDTFSSHKYSKSLLESLTGKRKELITFETGSGATLTSTSLQLRFQSMETCA
ncbi:putative alpha/Beta hydrolase [Plasmopara halstedii]